MAGLIALAACLVIIGVLQGQPGEVLMKAVTVCLECVGLG